MNSFRYKIVQNNRESCIMWTSISALDEFNWLVATIYLCVYLLPLFIRQYIGISRNGHTIRTIQVIKKPLGRRSHQILVACYKVKNANIITHIADLFSGSHLSCKNYYLLITERENNGTISIVKCY
uniref:Replication enhancer n=1 Tax=Heterorhabditis bacteriophora TaxID=37862 RepID=A0A1I7WK71_HETBA